MKNSKQILGLFLMTVALMTSCQKDENGDNDILDVTIERASPQDFTDLKATALENLKQTFQIDVDGSGTFTTQKGVEITINGSCLANNGNAVTGMVDVEVIELFDRGTMLATNKTTMGLSPTGGKELLVTGGEFFIEATQNGQLLQLICPMQVLVPTALTGGDDTGMTLWDGLIGMDCDIETGCDDVTWVEQKRDGLGAGIDIGQGAAGQSLYMALFNSFGWTNVDRFWNDPRPKTKLWAAVPEGFDNGNCALYLSYNGEAGSLANLDAYDPETGLFSEHTGIIPIGLECHVIFVSEDNGNWVYAINPVTIIADGTIVVEESDLSTTTESQLITMINALP
ncbi:hypothetical protein [Arenibacter echinorum]|uniref:Uncharacterized protein n=1 Tax=Arenibacter echinorum TaxID=440515 RepID=A0A327RAB3_9FLAO|nr:hypothetical protein [Arenibacter echinorum]RAJ12423.1 hypothetical protein LV92_01658 [Arenibacter echinorum]